MRKVLQQALEHLKRTRWASSCEAGYSNDPVIAAIEHELAKPEQVARKYQPEFRYTAKPEQPRAEAGNINWSASDEERLDDAIEKAYGESYMSTNFENVNTSEERVQVSDKSVHEPVAEVVSDHHAGMYKVFPLGTLLYTSPPRKEWVSLKDDEIDKLRSGYQSGRIGTFVELTSAIEAELKTKNL